MVEWLNTSFSGIDGSVFRFMNLIANPFLTFIARALTFIGEKGIIYFLAGVILMLFSKRRKTGATVFASVCFGVLITTFILKNTVARPRPFIASEEFKAFWEYIGSPNEKGYSFPSGHATSVTAAATAFFIMCDKKWSFIGYIFAFIMCFSRTYLIAHYFTDVLAGVAVGILSGILGYLSIKLIYFILEKYPENKFCNFVLTWDAIKLKK